MWADERPKGCPRRPATSAPTTCGPGKLRWTFHTIPHPGEFGYDTWPKDAWTYSGAANNWPGMAVDEKRGIVFVPTGSAAADFYGADRLGDNLFANYAAGAQRRDGRAHLALPGGASTICGIAIFPRRPTLVTVRQNGRQVDAVAQTTKHGYVFLFDRATGKPLFPIE